MLRLLLFIAFLVVPLLEIWLVLQIGQVIGGWQTVALLLADSALGAWIVRREGRRAWRNLQEALTTGRMPERELGDGAMVVAGGALLLTPGFITDAVGFALVLPFTRPLVRRLAAWFFARRVRTLVARSSGPGATSPLGGPFGGLGDPFGDPRGAAGPAGRSSGRVVHGEVVRDDAAGGEPAPDADSPHGSRHDSPPGQSGRSLPH
jgi:UPF0716 protein FxsA